MQIQKLKATIYSIGQGIIGRQLKSQNNFEKPGFWKTLFSNMNQ